MRPIELIYVPYDSGHAGQRFGRAPLLARDSGLAGRLRNTAAVGEHLVTHGGYFPTEARVAFDLAARIAGRVAEARASAAFPVVLAGNCISSVGTVSGMGGSRPGVVWLDAHTDFHTPDTSDTAFIDGMGAAILVGEAWAAAAAALPGFRPVERRNLLFIGPRDIDPGEAARLADPPVAVFSGADWRRDPDAVASALAALGTRCDAVYLHVDMDVTDPDPVPANEYAVPGGLDRAELSVVLRLVADCAPLAAAGVTAFDPSLDRDGVMLARYLAVIEQLATMGAED